MGGSEQKAYVVPKIVAADALQEESNLKEEFQAAT